MNYSSQQTYILTLLIIISFFYTYSTYFHYVWFSGIALYNRFFEIEKDEKLFTSSDHLFKSAAAVTYQRNMTQWVLQSSIENDWSHYR